MVYIEVKAFYPPQEGGEIGKLFIEVLQKFPEDENMLKRILTMVRARKNVNEAITIYEIVDGKYKEALVWIGTMMQEYMVSENFSYEANTYLNAAEALPIVGLSA